MKFLKKKFLEILFRHFQKQVSEVPFTRLTQEQKDGLLSQLWQNDAFRNYIIRRETELMLLYESSKNSYNRIMKIRQNKTFTKVQQPVSSQAFSLTGVVPQ